MYQPTRQLRNILLVYISLLIEVAIFADVPGGPYEVWHEGNLDPATMGGSAVAISDTPPASPVDGQLWWESDTGILAIRYNDGTSTQWVAISEPDLSPKPPTTTISTEEPSGGVDGDVWYQVT